MSNRGNYKGTGTGVLSLDSKRMARVADPLNAQDAATRNFVRGASSVPPSYYPGAMSSHFDPYTSMYGATQASLHTLRAALKKTASSTASLAPFHVFFLGDSTLIGYNGTPGGAPIGYNSDRAIPRQFGLALSSILGGIPYVDGVRQAVVAITAPQGDRTVLTGSFLSNVGIDYNLLTSSGAGTATWRSVDAGTSVEFYYSDLSTSGFTYSIDGAAPVSVTTGATATIKKVTVAGLADTPHTIVITTTGAACYITGWRVFTPALVQIHAHNLAIGGTHANGTAGGQAGSNWSDATATGLQNSTALMMGAGAANITPNLLVVCCGNNDAAGTATPAEAIITGLKNMRNMWPTVPCLFVHPPMVPGSEAGNFDRFSAQIITMIDAMNAAGQPSFYFDWDDWDARTAGYNADGLAGGDNIHPIDAEAMSLARHLASEVVGSETYATPLTAQAVITDLTTSGTAEQITYQRPIPSWFWRVGGTIRVVQSGTCTSGTNPTLATHCRIGILGTTADNSIAATTASAIITAGAGWRYEVELTCRVIGTSGTIFARSTLMVDGIAVKVSNETAVATVNTSVYNYLTLTLTPAGTTPVFVRHMAFCDVPPGP